MFYTLTFLIILSSIFCIHAKYKKYINQLLIFKLLALVLIILITIVFPAVDRNYRIIIVTGLLFSLIGDTYLVFPEQYFKKGLIAFLIGHICYIIAFIVSAGFHFTLWIFLPIIVVGTLYLRIILPCTGKMQIPVTIYIIVIVIMGWLAIERFHQSLTLGTSIAAIGAVLFMISDAVLAFNKFRKPFASAELTILSTYFTAQWLLALSVITP